MSDKDQRQYAPAFQRNCYPILAVLEQELPREGIVLEVASGTGEHAAFLAQHLPALRWLPSDQAQPQLQSIRAWRHHTGLANLYDPIPVDVLQTHWPEAVALTLNQYGFTTADVIALVNINMIHIAPWQAAEGLLAGAAQILPSNGILYLYGPFIQTDHPTAPGNSSFDRSLRNRNPEWGIRHLDAVIDIAAHYGLILQKTVAMPANNLSVMWRKSV